MFYLPQLPSVLSCLNKATRARGRELRSAPCIFQRCSHKEVHRSICRKHFALLPDLRSVYSILFPRRRNPPANKHERNTVSRAIRSGVFVNARLLFSSTLAPTLLRLSPPRLESTVGRLSPLFCRRRNKILRESNFAEKSKFSPSNSFCAVPTDSAPRDASTREGGGKRVKGKRGEGPSRESRTRLVLPEEIPHFGFRRWRNQGLGGLKIRV